ncbi:D-cysteine desulfhydrase [Neobacillus bataviensis LMG 21833]|uniref:D-cysteine desulfhydrase n=1 Tax=Neobacillus bataviensis LMG 21833 TaxID=1117379 RepID=K6DGG2_9BACI|nr:D-cysteine desulfhydrase [Neobacillus bataviensis]EKN71657.1 D-cysteine desulfhydrase [Neobacillus bataviensis LMG 21833]
MNLVERYPKRNYTPSATPIEKLEHLSRALGGPDIYIKRDDLLGLTAGGNKTRKLEYLVADALEQGADTLITAGGVQSNHARLTLAAAVKEGLKCQLVLEETETHPYNDKASGNNLLYHLLGVEKVKTLQAGQDLTSAMAELNAELQKVGRKGYMIPVGGSNEIGSLGYAVCANEITRQAEQENLYFDHIVVPSGSGGTQVGLILGFSGSRHEHNILGINVSRSTELQEELISGLLERVCSYYDVAGKISENVIRCNGEYVGQGYAIPTEGMIEAVQLVAQTEGILLDPVYTGKAMAGLIDYVRTGQFKEGEKVLFVHTGGSPALYQYAETILSGLKR